MDDYRRHATAHAAMEYGDKASVRRGNDAADAMRAMAHEIAGLGRGAVRQFAALLDEPVTSGWAAHHLIELMAAEPILVQRALSVIEVRSRGDDATALGERMWLQAWRARDAAGESGAHEA